MVWIAKSSSGRAIDEQVIEVFLADLCFSTHIWPVLGQIHNMRSYISVPNLAKCCEHHLSRMVWIAKSSSGRAIDEQVIEVFLADLCFSTHIWPFLGQILNMRSYIGT